MAHKNPWYGFALRFRSLNDTGLRAEGTRVVGSEAPWEWNCVGAHSKEIKLMYKAIATEAGAELNPQSQDPLGAFLEAMRRFRFGFASMPQEAYTEESAKERHLVVTILNLCKESADFCLVQAGANAKAPGFEISSSLLAVAPEVQTLQSAADEKAKKSAIRKTIVMPLLKAKGWTQTKWADEAKVTQHLVSNYLTGKTNLHPEFRVYLAKALSLAPEELPD